MLNEVQIRLLEGAHLDAYVHEQVVGEEVLTRVTAWSQEDWDTSDYPTVKNGYGTPNPAYLGDTIFQAPRYLTIPKYSDDLNLAYHLLIKSQQDLILIPSPHGALLIFRERGEYYRWLNLNEKPFVMDTNPATAICKALLLLKMLQNESETSA